MTVIRVENLTKEYRLGSISHGTLREDLQSWWARLRGKEDPNSIITHQQINQEQRTKHEAPSTTNEAQSTKHEAQDLNPHFLALNNVSFDVKQGEAVGIIGRNGAGKSTLLKILSRVTTQTSGVVKIKGRVASLLEVGTGFHPDLTGRENIFLNGTILGMKRAEIQRKFDEIVAFAEIEQFIDTPVKRYSSGMYVRLAFAVAAHLEPEILIVDEVLAVGDAAFQKKCLGKMGNACSEGQTVIFVTHNMTALAQLCTRAILLEKGSKQMDSTCNAVIQKYVGDNSTDANYVVIKKEQHLKSWGGSDRIVLYSVKLLNSPTTTFSVFWKQDIKIELTLDVLVPVKYVSLGIGISNLYGEVIMAAHHNDRGAQLYDFSPGRYRVIFSIENSLRQGKYVISVGADTSVGHASIFHVSDAVQLEVLGVGINDEHPPEYAGIINGNVIWSSVEPCIA